MTPTKALEGRTIVHAVRRRVGGHSGRSPRVIFTLTLDDGTRLVIGEGWKRLPPLKARQKRLLLSAIRSGIDLRQAAACAGLTPQQVFMRRRRDPSFARAIEEALDACAAAITRESAP